MAFVALYLSNAFILVSRDAGTTLFSVVYLHTLTTLSLHRTTEIRERLTTAQDQLRQAESDLEELHGERSGRYKELKKKDETMKGSIDVLVQVG